MRQFLVVALAAVGLFACASSDSTRQAAIRQCESVGITQKDPQFDLCTRSYTLQANQDNLEDSYRRALNPTYDRRLAHQWYGF